MKQGPQNQETNDEQGIQRGVAGVGDVNQIRGNNNRIGGTNIFAQLSIPIVLAVILGGAYIWMRSTGNGYSFPQGQPPSEAKTPSPQP